MPLLKTLQRVQSRPHVAFVDDERSQGNSIIVTLADGYDFRNEPGCGVQGFDTASECEAGTRNDCIIKSQR